MHEYHYYYVIVANKPLQVVGRPGERGKLTLYNKIYKYYIRLCVVSEWSSGWEGGAEIEFQKK